jgi:hypothetical protein
MGFFDSFPDPQGLQESSGKRLPAFPLKVNNHIHTPYSFSAFDSVEDAVRKAAKEQVRILGINDFYVIDGYGEFIEACGKYRVFPLLNIELIGISSKDQQAGIRVNDPKNPGRIYISGKGLDYPSSLPPLQQEKLDRIVEGSNKQVASMIELLNKWLEFQDTGIGLSVDEIMEKHALHLLRERHVARALRLKLEEIAKGEDHFKALLAQVYGGKPSDKQINDRTGIEEELRARLLKSGAPAFVPEDENAFMRIEEILEIIREAGGIPTYPMLLDGAGDEITEFEHDREKLLEELNSRGFNCVELIPLRNRPEVLKHYAEFFYEQGFVVSFGTEHNTSAMGPLTVSALGGDPLDESLMNISFKGAAYQAAHQYLVAKEGKGYEQRTREEMEKLGKAVLDHYYQKTA